MLTAYCHVLPDRIIFTPQYEIGPFMDENVLMDMQKRSFKVRSILYPIFIFATLCSFYYTADCLLNREYLNGLFFLGLGIVLLRILLLYLFSNPTLSIKRDQIISIKPRKEIAWLGIWPMFIIRFTKENGKPGRKIIAMKYTMSDEGKQHYDMALLILQTEGLL